MAPSASLAASGLAHLPRIENISIDPWVLAFTLVISLAAGLIFGLIPVFKYARPHLSNALRSGGRSLSQSKDRHRARSILVVVQVALALVLLIGSGLMIRTFQALRQVDPGFSGAQAVQTLRISIPAAQVKEPERVMRMEQDIVDKIAALPGVSSAALTTSITMDGNDSNDPIFAEDHVYREGYTPSHTPLQMGFAGLPLHPGRPSDRGPRPDLDRHLQQNTRSAGIGEYGARIVARPSPCLG